MAIDELTPSGGTKALAAAGIEAEPVCGGCYQLPRHDTYFLNAMHRFADHVHRLLEELKEATPEVDEVAQMEVASSEDGSAWAVSVGGDLAVMVDFAPDADVLTFSAALGLPEPAQRLAVCEALMTWNSVAPPGNRLVMAVAQPDGGFFQVQDIPSDGVTPLELGPALVLFAAKARVWRQVVAQGAPASALPAEMTQLIAAGIRA